jgi:hypothetical protein
MTVTTCLQEYSTDPFEPEEPTAAAREAWERALHATENWFGRLVWLASCRVDNSDRYEHPTLASLTCPNAASDLLRESHQRMFYEWLGLPLEVQCKHVVEHLAAVDRNASEQLKQRIAVLVPSAASAAERELFRIDLEFVLCLTENSGAAAGSDSAGRRSTNLA